MRPLEPRLACRQPCSINAGSQERHVQAAHKNIIDAGRPSVSLRLQLYQIWGINWTHHSTVPIVPSTFEATVTLPPPDMTPVDRLGEGLGG
jgi:hypothetical protein